jgi:hypothetical protein
MADLTLTGKNNQKREISVAVCETVATSATMDETLFNLPVNSLVMRAQVLVETVSGAATSTVDVKVGATVVANEVAVTSAGLVDGSVTPAQFATGGAVSVVAGAVAPDAAGRIRVILEYIELDTTTGMYIG